MAHNGNNNGYGDGYQLQGQLQGASDTPQGPVVPHNPNGYATNGYAQQRNNAEDGGALEWDALWQTIRRGKWIILLTTVLVTAGVTAYTLLMEPVYESGSIVSINTRSRTASLALGNEAPTMETTTLTSEVGFLQNSAALAVNVVQRLQESADALGTDEHFPLLEEKGLTTRERARELLEQVTFGPLDTEGLISIQAESHSPEEAASIANFYAKEYKRISQEQSRERVAAARGFLQEQVQKRGSELRSLEGQLENFAREKQTATQGQGGEALVAEYRELRRQRDQTQFELEQEQVALQRLQQQLSQAKPNLEEQVQQEGETSELEEQISTLDQRIAGLKAEAEEYYAVNPDLRGQETNIDELESIKDRIDHFSERKRELTDQLVQKEKAAAANGEGGPLGYVAQLKSRISETQLNIQALQSQISTLNGRLSSYDGRLAGLPRQSIERGQLERQIARAERWYNSFVDQLQQVKVAEESELGNVRVVRSALVPVVPARPNVQQNILLGLLLGLGFGIGLAFVRGASDRRLTGPEDVEEQGYELVGVIPEMKQEIKKSFNGQDVVEVEGRELSTSLMTLLNPLSPVAENFRLIRTNIQHAQVNGSPVQTLLVTSPGPAEGKSVASVNLAAAMAQGGRRTLLIDADIRRPSAHRLLGASLEPGLADLLTGRRSFHPEDFKTNVKGLSFLPAGKLEGKAPTEFFESRTMKDLMAKLRQYYEVILLDSPPVLAVTDAVVLATHSDAAVVVASANRTDAHALRATQNRLRAVGTRVAGAIVNRVDDRSAFQDYGYEYGHEYYNSYAGMAEEEAGVAEEPAA